MQGTPRVCLEFVDTLASVIDCNRYAPSVDLILLSHGDLAHVGLYPFAYARWNLKAPAYSTLPVQAMGRIAVSEDVEGIRDEEDVGDGPGNNADQDETGQPEEHDTVAQADKLGVSTRRKYVATLAEVHDAFEYLNTLRYSQPTHLQGSCSRVQFCFGFLSCYLMQENARVSPSLLLMLDIPLVAPSGKFVHLRPAPFFMPQISTTCAKDTWMGPY